MKYEDIRTIGNTGVIIFGINEETEEMSDTCLGINLSDRLNMKIQIVTYFFEEMEKIKNILPDWWNENKDWRHNIIFLVNDYPVKKILPIIKVLNSEIEKAMIINDVIIWSSAFKDRKLYYKSKYSKMLKEEAYPYMTIRNANTLDKIFKIVEESKEI